jgi:uncharacterized protein (DUF885 family)
MPHQVDFDGFVETIYVEMMRTVPELPLLMGILQVGAAACPLDRFSTVSEEAIADRERVLKSVAHRLACYSRDSLNAGQQLTADVLQYFLESGLEGPWIGSRGANFARHSYLVNPGHGEPSRLLDSLTQQHPFRRLEDAEDYLIRSESLGQAIAQIEDQVTRRKRRGIMLPAPLLRQSIDELRGMLALAPDMHPVYRAFAEKSQGVAGLSPGRRQALLSALLSTLNERLLPAYESLARQLERDIDSAGPELGLWRLPDGEAYYQFLLQAVTTTALSAAEVHELGMAHVSILQEEIRGALHEAGLPNRDPIKTLRALESQTRFAPSTPRDAVLERCHNIVDDIRGKVSNLFRWLPDPQIIIEPVPAFSEDVRHSVYVPSAADGSRPACMVINLRDVAADSELDLPTLLYHELYPGHHLQFSYAQQLRNLPTFRRTITFDAYIEGWAKYAERIPQEHQFNPDPRWHAMRLRRELLSTANLVLDTGIHSGRWTLRRATSYLSDTTGCSVAMARSIALRSASVPAQLCAYKIGMMQVAELKEQFACLRGAAFDIRDFHTAILETGALPLKVLKRVVEAAARAVPTD